MLTFFMTIIIWNYRSASSPILLRIVQDLKGHHNAIFIALLETRMSSEKIKKLCKKVGFDGSHIVEAHGFLGRIWPLGSTKCNFIPFCHNEQFVLLEIKEGSANSWWLTMFMEA